MSATATQAVAITEHEAAQVERANGSGKTPVVYSVPGSGEPIFQAANANLNPWSEAKVDTKNPERARC